MGGIIIRKRILKLSIQALFVFFAFSQASAQTQFLVFQLKGEAYIEKLGKQQLLKIGQLLNPADVLKMRSKASVTLVCPNYMPVNLAEAGTYNVSSLNKNCSVKSSSISSSYWKYIWTELTKHPSDPDEDRRKYMSNTGSAVRGCPGITMPSIFDTVMYHSGSLNFKWETIVSLARLHFVVYEGPKDKGILMDIPLTSTCLSISELLPKMETSRSYYWNFVIDGREECPRKVLQLASSSDYADVLKLIEQESGPILDEADRLFMTGFLLEERHFLAEASEYYLKAASIRKIPSYEKAATELGAKLACR